MNQLVVELGLEIESGKRQPHVDNAKLLINGFHEVTGK